MKTVLLLLYLSLSFTPLQEKSISFTLHNSSLKSIPLQIPGVMNPNLSPMSNSGVTLDIGQEIVFKINRKKYVLLVVDESMEGKTLDVAKLLRQRKKEINTKKTKR